jgi:hypothetical protein
MVYVFGRSERIHGTSPILDRLCLGCAFLPLNTYASGSGTAR